MAYFYDGEPYWNAVWSHVFWNRKIREVYVLAHAKRVPGPLPQQRVEPFPHGSFPRTRLMGRRRDANFTFPGEPVATITQVGLGQNGLTLWRSGSPLKLQTARVGVQGNGDIYGPASMTAYGCRGGTFELTLIAKGSPVTVRLDNGQSPQERALAPEEIWRASVPAVGPEVLSARSRSRRAGSSARPAVRVRPGLLAAGTPRLDRAGEVGERDHARHRPSSTTSPRSIPRLNAWSACSSDWSPERRARPGAEACARRRACVPLAARNVGDHPKREQTDGTPAFHDGVRVLSVGRDDAVHQLADRLTRSDRRRGRGHQIAHAQARERAVHLPVARLRGGSHEQEPPEEGEPEPARSVLQKNSASPPAMKSAPNARPIAAATRVAQLKSPRAAPQGRPKHPATVERQRGKQVEDQQQRG